MEDGQLSSILEIVGNKMASISRRYQARFGIKMAPSTARRCPALFTLKVMKGIKREHRFDEKSSRQLHIWQKLHFDALNGDCNAKLDCLRCVIYQLQLTETVESLSPLSCAEFLTKYGKEYEKLMDTRDGVSNYENEILEAVKWKKSDKGEWKSDLKLESVLKLKFVDDFVERNKTTAKRVVTAEMQSATRFLTSLKQSYEAAAPKNDHSDTSYVFPARREVENRPRTLQIQGLKRKQDFSENVEDKRIKTGDVHRFSSSSEFNTAKTQLFLDNAKKVGARRALSANDYGVSKKSLGCKSNVNGSFVPPVLNGEEGQKKELDSCSGPIAELMSNEHMKNVDAKMVEMIVNEIMDNKRQINWEDIAGLDFAKKMVKEMVVLPMIRPDLCTRLRRPPKGLLLFGPPGTGKTLIGKVIASNSRSTFFSISASSLTSKWIGEGEKMVRALFAVAQCYQPSVIFIDEIDSLLTQRNDSEHESSRRMKTEFLVQLDGATTSEDDKILVVGATNRPQELDEAARRRLSKRLYISLPNLDARKQIIQRLMCGENHELSEHDISDIGLLTDGYSGADMANVCKEAAYGPIRGLSFEELESMPTESVRPICHGDFVSALSQVKASVCKSDLRAYEDWNSKFGSTCQ